MAEPIKYHPPLAGTEATPREELETLLITLHETGTLRLVNALAGHFADLAEVAVNQLNTDSGHKFAGNVSALLATLSVIPAHHLQALMEGAAEGLEAHELQGEKSPGLLRLMSRMRDEDARRGLNLVVTVLQHMGRRLSPDGGCQTASLQGQKDGQ